MPKATNELQLPFASAELAAEVVRWLSYLSAERRMSPKTVEAYGRDVPFPRPHAIAVKYGQPMRFEKLRQRYVDALAWSLQNRVSVFVLFVILVGSAFAILPIVGRDFFPTVDAGQFRLHVNAPPGTRLEESEKIFSKVEDVIREVVPPSDLAMVLDNIGTPQGINLALALVIQPTLDQLRSEYIALQQKLLVVFQRVQRIIE